MDEGTLKLGLLVEAAMSQQKLAESSVKRLKAVTNDLVAVVRQEVHAVILEELQSLTSDSQRAADALHAVRHAASMRVLSWSVGMTTLCSLIPLGLASWIIPSRSEIEKLRAKHDELASAVRVLEDQGGRIDLRRCGREGRLCVRVDRKAPTYGNKADYLIVGGY